MILENSQATDDALFLPVREVYACPACSANVTRSVGHSAPGWKEEIAGRVFRHPDYEVRYCDNCGLYFKSRILTDSALTDFYRGLPFETFESSELFPTDRLVLRAIASAQAGAKILDFGCGIGRILGHLTSNHRCYGVEVNPRSAELASAKGVKIVPEFAISSGSERDFDFVILSDVFEHIPSPFKFIRMLARVLKPAGALIISTGNGDAVRCKEYLSHFWYFRALGHLQMLSPKHLKWCARRLNLALADCHATSHYVTPFFQQCRQRLSTWAFHQFHLRPHQYLTSVLRLLPKIQQAAKWSVAPAITCTSDHLVAVLTKNTKEVEQTCKNGF